MAKNNITAQVHALFPNISLNIPAAIPPKIPPTSNKVDKSALCEGLYVAIEKCKLYNISFIVMGNGLTFTYKNT